MSRYLFPLVLALILAGCSTRSPTQQPQLSAAVSEVAVTIDGERWVEVKSLEGSGADDPHFAVDRQTGTIRFGDGARGRRPRAGARIEATYRYGGGAGGNVVAVSLDAPAAQPVPDQLLCTIIRQSANAISFETCEEAAAASSEAASIEAVVLDYVEGWWSGDVERMDRSLHPDLVKRIVTRHPETGRSLVNDIGKSNMVEYTRAGGGSADAQRMGTVTIKLLDLNGDMASVRAESAEYLDYIHLVKWNGRWVIINVIWNSK